MFVIVVPCYTHAVHSSMTLSPSLFVFPLNSVDVPSAFAQSKMIFWPINPMLLPRSPESKKRKAATVNGPSAKKAKPSAESSSSDESSSEDEEAATASSKAAPAGTPQ